MKKKNIMLKNILASIGGLATALGLIALLEMLDSSIYKLPPGLDSNNIEALKIYIASLPVWALLLLLLNYALASFAGGMVAGLISRQMRQPVTIGVLLTMANIINLHELPHPMWFMVLSSILYVPFAFIGGRMGINFNSKTS
jgi:hypothetical protein